MRRVIAIGSLALAAAALVACPKRHGRGAGSDAASPADAARSEGGELDASSSAARDAAPMVDANAAYLIDASDDPRDDHKTTHAALLELLPFGAESKYLDYAVGLTVGKMSQGNPEIAQHAISKKACLEGLRGVVLQTDEQKAICGADNMVPIYKGGDPRAAKTCIDIFEFPNQACELPFVWMSPSMAEKTCEIGGKRLCADQEWNLACRGDPEGGEDSIYAYGSALDLTICNTNKPHPMGPDGRNWICYVKDAETAWKTCETDTEPSGSYPRCRSRFGVYDQHGNVAEMMTRKAGDKLLTQLKGSAFFYVDVSREYNVPHPKGAPHDTYPDHCNYDPRWHVENLKEAMHTNYHLGFRCCKSITERKDP